MHDGQNMQEPHSLVGRVEALEEAVEVLLAAKVCELLSCYLLQIGCWTSGDALP